MNWYLHSCRAVQSYPIVKWWTNSLLLSLVIWLAHYVSVFLTVGSMLMINLRVLNITGKNQTIMQIVDFYYPWMRIGLTVLFVSGGLMLAGDSIVYCENGIFGINLVFTVLAAISAGVIHKKAQLWDEAPSPPVEARIVAVVSLLLWLGTILSAVEVPAISDVS